MHSYIKEYAEAIKTGDVVVGWKIKAVINHLLESMEDERFIFDPTYAHKRMDFQEKYCLQGKAPYYGVPIKLMLWQKAFWEAYYGFYMKDTGARRFTEGHIEIARKNGKTTMFAADANTDLFIGEGGIDICCASNDDRQAKLIWKETAGMQKRLDPKDEITKHNLVEIYNHKKNITIFRLSSKSQNKDGFNCKKFYLDECHEAENDEIYDALKRSQSTHKRDRSALSCSTQGVVVDGFYDEYLKRANEAVDNPNDNIHFLAFLYEQDSPNEVWIGDRENRLWEKSNPSLKYGVKGWDHFDEQLALARVSKKAKIKMLVKDFNIKQNNAESWLALEEVENLETFDLEDFRNCFYIGGVDLSKVSDLTAAALLFMKPESNKKYVYMKYFLPTNKIQNSKDSGAEYKDWFSNGLIIRTGEFENEPAMVADWLYKLKKEYNITPYRVGYDPWNADAFVKKMGQTDGYFYDDTTERVTQGKALDAFIRQLENELIAKNINYDNNPILKWNLLNCVLEVDNRDKCQLNKMKNQPDKKIDGALALVIALKTLHDNREEYKKLINR